MPPSGQKQTHRKSQLTVSVTSASPCGWKRLATFPGMLFAAWRVVAIVHTRHKEVDAENDSYVIRKWRLLTAIYIYIVCISLIYSDILGIVYIPIIGEHVCLFIHIVGELSWL